MASEAKFSTYNIRNDQEVTSAVRQDAQRAYRQAIDHYWNQDSKTEFVNHMGQPIDKPGSLDEWREPLLRGSKDPGLREIPRYADLNKKLDELDNFFASASDEEIRKALAPPNDMGKYAEEAYLSLMQEKNYQDNLFNQGQLPDTDARKSSEVLKEQNKNLSDEQKDQRAKDLLKAAEEARKQTNEVKQTLAPAKSIEFKQQQLLQAKLLDIIKHRHAITEFDPERQKTYPYVEGSPNASIMLHGDPATCINDLLVYQDTETFFRMKSQDIASLQPEIRFFKVTSDPETKKDRNVEILFDTALSRSSLNSLLRRKNKRGTGVGIREFDITFDGKDVFAAKKSFKASLTIFANSFEELFKPRGGRLSPYRYIDLALKTGKRLNDAVKNKTNPQKTDVLTEDLARLDFSIKVKLGLKEPKTLAARSVSGLRGAIKRNTITLHLVPTIHSFDFNQDGSVVFKVEYLPFNNQRFAAQTFDIFRDTDSLKKEFDKQVQLKHSLRNCKVPEIKKNINSQTGDAGEKGGEAGTRQDAISSIIRSLHANKRVNYLQVHPEVLEKFTKNANSLSFEEILELSKGAEFLGNEGKPDGLEGDIKKDVNNPKPTPIIKTKVNSPTINVIPYVFVSDIIDAVLANITKSVSPEEITSVSKFFDSTLGTKKQEITENLRALQDEYVDKVVDSIYGDGSSLQNPEEANRNAIETAFLDMYIEEQSQELEDIESLQELAQEMVEDFKKDSEDFRKFRVVLGPVELVDPFDPENITIASLGDVPISLPYLQEFLIAETLKNNSKRMTLSGFLNKIMNKLVKNALSDDSAFGGMLKQKVRLSKTEVSCVNKHSTKMDDLTFLMKQTNKMLEENYDQYVKKATGFTADDWSKADISDRLTAANVAINPRTSRAFINHLTTPILETAGIGAVEDPTSTAAVDLEMNYLIFHVTRTTFIGNYLGNRADDAERGVHHYAIGRDRGIIKEISLTRDSRPGVREARFEQEGFDGLSQLREVYNVDVDCYANFNVFPGTKIFVDPRGWIPNLDAATISDLGSIESLTNLGIGGYYDVQKVTHKFGYGVFDTKFDAKWTAEIRTPKKLEKSGKPSESNVSKCKSMSQDGDTKNTTSKNGNFNETMALAARAKALVVSGFDEMLADSEGFIDRAAGFFSKPSDNPE